MDRNRPYRAVVLGANLAPRPSFNIRHKRTRNAITAEGTTVVDGQDRVWARTQILSG